MKFRNIIIMFLMGLIIAFPMGVAYKSKSTNTQVTLPPREKPVLQIKEITPTKCNEFYQIAENELKRFPGINNVHILKSLANSLMYQNCVARNGK